MLFLHADFPQTEYLLFKFAVLTAVLINFGLVPLLFLLMVGEGKLQSLALLFEIEDFFFCCGQLDIYDFDFICYFQCALTDLLCTFLVIRLFLSLLKFAHDFKLFLEFDLEHPQLLVFIFFLFGHKRLLIFLFLHQKIDLILECEDILSECIVLLLDIVVDFDELVLTSDGLQLGFEFLLFGIEIHSTFHTIIYIY